MFNIFLLCNNQKLNDNELESIIFCKILSSNEINNQFADISSLNTNEVKECIENEFKSQYFLKSNTPFYDLYHKLLKITHFSELFQKIIILIKEYCVEYGKKYEKFNDKIYNVNFLLAMGADYLLNNRYDEIVGIIQSYKQEQKDKTVLRPQVNHEEDIG
ncbi:hypothetical protein COBT_001425 [Conglomerata obtusa]